MPSRRRLLAVPLALCVALSGARSAAAAEAAAESNPDLVTVCADGAVNGLITISIALTASMFADMVLPRPPMMLGIGLVVGCSVRVIGTQLEGYGLSLWHSR